MLRQISTGEKGGGLLLVLLNGGMAHNIFSLNDPTASAANQINTNPTDGCLSLSWPDEPKLQGIVCRSKNVHKIKWSAPYCQSNLVSNLY